MEAADFLLMAPEALRRKAKLGEIPGAKPGKHWVFIEEHLAEWLRNRYANSTKILLTYLFSRVTIQRHKFGTVYFCIWCYNYCMKRNCLMNTNPHLKDPKQRIKLIRRSVESSSAIEGIFVKLGRKKHSSRRKKSIG